ncbi:hypothetical protein HPP92_009536 [Vanilla planifolia]|uniref:Uncharacterized protein n=1 Tax=Vanilla planifolia TaxID=51239 RepID=A0A835RE26_VANPL|nr:hypothetical protein HPP92_009536 [Vanilla planifolia]
MFVSSRSWIRFLIYSILFDSRWNQPVAETADSFLGLDGHRFCWERRHPTPQPRVLKALVPCWRCASLKRLRRSTTRWDHARAVAQALSGEKGASLHPDKYFNLSHFCFDDVLIAEVLPSLFRLRFYIVKPCSKEMKCDVELSSYAIRDTEEYKNFCDRSKDQRPRDEEVIGDIAEHLTTIHLSRCERGKHCLYEGSTGSGGFPNSWNGASYCSSELIIHKNGEVHAWDRGYDLEGIRSGDQREAHTCSNLRQILATTTCSLSISLPLISKSSMDKRINEAPHEKSLLLAVKGNVYVLDYNSNE